MRSGTLMLVAHPSAISFVAIYRKPLGQNIPSKIRSAIWRKSLGILWWVSDCSGPVAHRYQWRAFSYLEPPWKRIASKVLLSRSPRFLRRSISIWFTSASVSASHQLAPRFFEISTAFAILRLSIYSCHSGGLGCWARLPIRSMCEYLLWIWSVLISGWLTASQALYHRVLVRTLSQFRYWRWISPFSYVFFDNCKNKIYNYINEMKWNK